MSATGNDFPDWNPPQSHLARVAVDTLPLHILAHDQFDTTIPRQDLNDVMVVTGQLLDGCAVLVNAGDNIPPDDAFGRMLGSFGPFPFIELPVQHRGAGLNIAGINGTASAIDMTLTVFAYTGANVDTIVGEACLTQIGGVPITAGATLDPLHIDQAGLYDRATISIVSDQACTVTLRRRMWSFNGLWTVTNFDELLATLSGAGSRTFDVPIGAPAAAIVFHNTSGATSHVSLLARCYRPVGS